MDFSGFVLSTIALVILFFVLRRIERWLHQHMFKVGWLVTQNYQTTTILYYTFFLPGVVLHELVYWLVAGMLNVRASQTMKWPDAQEVGELKLNFVQISRTDPYRKAIITAAPLVAGIAVIWLIASNRLNMPLVVSTLENSSPDAFTNAAILLFNAPDFWLWAYFIFAIGNTMFPISVADLKPWRYILGAVIVVSAGLFLAGLGAEIFEAISPTLANILTALQISIVLVVGIDIVITAGLGTIEALIERFTGNSATFRNGKMITMTLAEVQEERRKAREQAQKKAERQQKQQAQGITSVYTLAFPIPGAPGQETITRLNPEPLVELAPEPEVAMPLSAPEIPAEPETEEELAARITFSGLGTNTSENEQPETTEDIEQTSDEDESERAAQILFNTPNAKADDTDNLRGTSDEGELAAQILFNQPASSAKSDKVEPETTQSESKNGQAAASIEVEEAIEAPSTEISESEPIAETSPSVIDTIKPDVNVDEMNASESEEVEPETLDTKAAHQTDTAATVKVDEQQVTEEDTVTRTSETLENDAQVDKPDTVTAATRASDDEPTTEANETQTLEDNSTVSEEDEVPENTDDKPDTAPADASEGKVVSSNETTQAELSKVTRRASRISPFTMPQNTPTETDAVSSPTTSDKQPEKDATSPRRPLRISPFDNSDQPAAALTPTSARKPVTDNDSSEEPTASMTPSSARSDFSARLQALENDADNSETQDNALPVTPRSSALDIRSRLRALENETASDSNDETDNEDLPIAPRSSTFDIRSRLRALENQAEEDNESGTDADAEELPIAPRTTFSSLRSRRNQEKSDDESDTETQQPSRPTRRANISPFSISPSNTDEEGDESILRRGSSEARNVFGSLSTPINADEEDDVDDDESILRRGRSEARNVFGSISIPRSDDKSDEDNTDDEDSIFKRPRLGNSRFNTRPASGLTSRFQPVPKPTSADNDEIEDGFEDEDITYEDVEDYVPDEDDDIYIDYDDED